MYVLYQGSVKTSLCLTQKNKSHVYHGHKSNVCSSTRLDLPRKCSIFFKAQTLWVDLVHGEVLYEVSK